MTDQPDQKPPVEIDTEKIPELLSILPLFDAALFPKMVLPLVVMQGESVRLVDEAMGKSRIIGLVVSQKPEGGLKPDREDLAQIGTSALILKMAKTQDNRTQLLVQGLQRFKIKSWENNRPYLRARIDNSCGVNRAHASGGSARAKLRRASETRRPSTLARTRTRPRPLEIRMVKASMRI